VDVKDRASPRYVLTKASFAYNESEIPKLSLRALFHRPVELAVAAAPNCCTVLLCPLPLAQCSLAKTEDGIAFCEALVRDRANAIDSVRLMDIWSEASTCISASATACVFFGWLAVSAVTVFAASN
jgi:hypothetical protein